MSHCCFCDESAANFLQLKFDEIFVDIVPLVLQCQKKYLNDHAKLCSVECMSFVKHHEIR